MDKNATKAQFRLRTRAYAFVATTSHISFRDAHRSYPFRRSLLLCREESVYCVENKNSLNIRSAPSLFKISLGGTTTHATQEGPSRYINVVRRRARGGPRKHSRNPQTRARFYKYFPSSALARRGTTECAAAWFSYCVALENARHHPPPPSALPLSPFTRQLPSSPERFKSE